MQVVIDRTSMIPLHEQVTEILTQFIVSGQWSTPDYQLPTEPELCEMFGVARGTVRQALAKLETDGYVRRERGRGTFVNFHANGNDIAKQQQIAFIVPYIRDSYVTTILAGMEKAASEQQWSLIFRHVENDLEKQRIALEELSGTSLAGVALYPVDSTDADAIKPCLDSGQPIVLLDRYLRGVSQVDYVVADNFGGAMQATQHLIQLGHQRIGFVTWQDDAVSLEHRALGFAQTMKESGLPYDESMICEVSSYPDISLEPLYPFLTQEPALDAIFAANDQIALAVYKAAQQLNLRIPYDIAIVGFDNLGVGEHLPLPLTTVSLPAFDMGYSATNLLFQRINNPTLPIQRVILQTELIVRQSCGAGLTETA